MRPRQVVILGAGLDSRSSRYGHLTAVEWWFEIDLPNLFAYKETVEEDVRNVTTTTTATRIAVDLTVENWVTALKKAGWDPTAPSFYILEGLVYYLDTDTAKALLDSVPSVPKQPHCRFDY